MLDWYDRHHRYQDASRDPEEIDRQYGRLYRDPLSRARRTAPKFDLNKESDAGVSIARLGSGNIYFRETAQRVLGERSSQAAEPLLWNLVLDQSLPHK